MTRNQSLLFCLALLLLGMTLPPSVAAQDQFEAPSWTLGWSTDMDDGFTIEMDDDWDIDGEIVAYIENTRMSQVELELTYEVNTWTPYTYEGPESITVAAGENKTFTITLSNDNDIDAREYNPDNTSALTVTADEKVGDTSTGNQEIEGTIRVPKVFNLKPEVTLSEDDLYAGSTVDLSIQLMNLGNAKDAVKDASAEVRSCPHLTVEGLDALVNTLVDPTGAQNGKETSAILTLVASESQPRRTCEVTISLVSEGDDTARSTTFDVDVIAYEEETKPTNDGNNDDDSTASEDGLSMESNTVPGFAAIEAIMVVAMVSLLRRKKTFN
ncbi:MAG: hypothetical protein P8Q85_06390 [Candidatus Poseidoniaceae archaeon]|nr:hypothetical protein [Candidatus Poseidoniaceae archaeon]MDG1557267.1 hypothetical protein [Candidatus Poseidoniaceae archaeon]